MGEPIATYRIEIPEEIPGVLSGIRPEPGGTGGITGEVAVLLKEVAERGDASLVEQARRFDWPCPDSASLRIFPRRPYVFFGYVMTLNHNSLLVKYHTQNSAGSAFVVTGYYLDYITFFYMRSHKYPNYNSTLLILPRLPAR